jgi:signal transduction histidine kinase
MRSFADVVRLPAPRREPCDVRRVLAHAVDLIQPDLQRRGICVEWQGDAALPPVSLDRAQIEQVLLNVLKNAMEAIGDAGGTVTIELGLRRARPYAVIRDTGAGLSAEARANVFTPFFTTKEDGQGIGLTVVQEILSAHRFGYSLAGPPGGPTEFTIAF